MTAIFKDWKASYRDNSVWNYMQGSRQLNRLLQTGINEGGFGHKNQSAFWPRLDGSYWKCPCVYRLTKKRERCSLHASPLVGGVITHHQSRPEQEQTAHKTFCYKAVSTNTHQDRFKHTASLITAVLQHPHSDALIHLSETSTQFANPPCCLQWSYSHMAVLLKT